MTEICDPSFNKLVDLGWVLEQHGDILQLKTLHKSPPFQKPFFVNFNSSPFKHRIQKQLPKESIAKAVGITGNYFPHILDLTAGWGRDAFVLAALGCEITMLERSPIVGALVENGLKRALQISELYNVAKKLTLFIGEAKTYLKDLPSNHYPDVIYLDPMFPENDQSALVKKEMRILRKLVGNDEDSQILFELALTRHQKRIVVKRNLKANTINSKKPSFQLIGKKHRFDVYCRN